MGFILNHAATTELNGQIKQKIAQSIDLTHQISTGFQHFSDPSSVGGNAGATATSWQVQAAAADQALVDSSNAVTANCQSGADGSQAIDQGANFGC